MENETRDVEVSVNRSLKDKLISFVSKHETYLMTVWRISLLIGYIFALIDWVNLLFGLAGSQNIVGFVFALLFNSVIMMVSGMIGAVIVFICIVAVTAIPYLIIRGLVK